MEPIKLNVAFSSSDNNVLLYKSIIEEQAKRDIPNAIMNDREKANTLLKLFLGSRDIRQGPQPGILAQAEMLKVIQHYISTNKPIPVLIPSGPKKTLDGESVDLAELSVLKNLRSIYNCARQIYEHSFVFVFRMEDVTGHYLEGENAIPSMSTYMRDFHRLIHILNMNDYTIIYKESNRLFEIKMNYEDYSNTTDGYLDRFYLYLTATDKQKDENEWDNSQLVEVGWQGTIPKEMREHYMKKYIKLFPNNYYLDNVMEMAKYFAGTLARHRLELTGKELFPSGHLEIGYAIPTPGVSESLNSTRVYYRSIRMKESKLNIPYWRAKGVFKIRENNIVKRSLVSWTNSEHEFANGRLLISTDEDEKKLKSLESVQIKSDILFE